MSDSYAQQSSFSFGGHNFLPLPSGALFWPAAAMLIAGDLHLEKGSAQARRGFFLPPYDSRETLNRLLAALAETNARRLLLLGDCFHDARGFARLGAEERALFDRLTQYAPVWIVGNHDGEFVPPGFDAHQAYETQGLTFRHEALTGAIREISAHFHPVANLVHKGARLRRRCFVVDEHKMLVPSFGAYTGGLSVTDDAIAQHFPAGGSLHVLGNERVVAVPYAIQ